MKKNSIYPILLGTFLVFFSIFCFQAPQESNLTTVDSSFNQIISELQKLWDMFSWKEFKKQLAARYTIYGLKATIKKGPALKNGEFDPTTREGEFRSKRRQVITGAVKNLATLENLKDEEIPIIGLAYSGGGYRAMTLTTGYQKAFEDLGILDASMYNASLSGSTWFIGPWTLQQQQDKKVTVAEFKQNLIDKINKKHFSYLGAVITGGKNSLETKDWNYKLFLNDAFWPKIVFGQIISLIDIYGGVLSNIFLYDFGDNRQRQRLSSQLNNIQTGNAPWPIYTAISPNNIGGKEVYDWYEFNPEEIRNLELDLAVSSFAFGQKFQAGISKGEEITDDAGKTQEAFPPEQSFGFLMGIFGSAFTISLDDAKNIMFPIDTSGCLKTTIFSVLKNLLSRKTDPQKMWNDFKDNLDCVKESIFNKSFEIIAKIPALQAGEFRASPAKIYNPFKEYAGLPTGQEWLKKQDQLTFIDAGIAYSIPIRPFFRDERNVDLIFVGNASTTLAPEQTLRVAFGDIQRFKGYLYQKDESKSDTTVWVYRPSEADMKKAESVKKNPPPIVVYINFVDDIALINKFQTDPELKSLVDANNLQNYNYQNALNGYAKLLNFDYTQEQFNQLSGWSEFVIKAHKNLFIDLINERIKLKQAKS